MRPRETGGRFCVGIPEIGELSVPRKVCVAAGCDDLALAGLSYCADHERRRKDRLKEKRAKAQTSEAAVTSRALYADQRWVRASKAFLRCNPLCADCAELGAVEVATDVDHITPHKGNRKLFWDRKNWQALCHPCHSRKTAHEVFHGKGGVSEK
ncbi:HNH endonuclease [Ruegeria litorea]|uniref:Putative HNH nuclease YajD n=1 Tax=Falsiruegeria litorea TaxID=1280831 RepID=A0ABS5WWA9_9RHOB|nr:HNH endonuclease signature motif containing protein [Falsiruegeria litorea]MBT3142904.1 HNH endonuclease [Falsiruegeria litorea]